MDQAARRSRPGDPRQAAGWVEHAQRRTPWRRRGRWSRSGANQRVSDGRAFCHTGKYRLAPGDGAESPLHRWPIRVSIWTTRTRSTRPRRRSPSVSRPREASTSTRAAHHGAPARDGVETPPISGRATRCALGDVERDRQRGTVKLRAELASNAGHERRGELLELQRDAADVEAVYLQNGHVCGACRRAAGDGRSSRVGRHSSVRRRPPVRRRASVVVRPLCAGETETARAEHPTLAALRPTTTLTSRRRVSRAGRTPPPCGRWARGTGCTRRS
jgi:hypothetical protein